MACPATDPGNAAQQEAWDGDTGAFWAEHADRFDAGVAAYRAPLLDAVGVGRDEQVLDVGCGAGQLARDLGRLAPDGAVLGVDLSARMLALAAARAAADGLGHVAFRRADAQVHPFPTAATDVVASRHGAMFFADPVAAFANLARALRPGGRVVLLTWQPLEHQEWLRSFRAALGAGRELPEPPVDAPSPLALSDPDRVRSLLEAAGLVDVTLEGVRAPMAFGPDADSARDFVAGQQAGLLRELGVDDRARALDALHADLTAHAGPGGVRYDSATWLVRARRP